MADEPKRDRKRVRIGVVNGPSGQHVIAALRKLERLPGRPPPGTLLLAQDPRSLNRCANSRCITFLTFMGMNLQLGVFTAAA